MPSLQKPKFDQGQSHTPIFRLKMGSLILQVAGGGQVAKGTRKGDHGVPRSRGAGASQGRGVRGLAALCTSVLAASAGLPAAMCYR